ncbi:MAG: indolepyruvate ferredoxin oxidoreductase subunit alpha [Anaerolineae bacterium]|jgi:indolepyruvate ferredoxin oxidoreductase alpha subunit|nr:indolepyruvate ferredoxin oxidoreductase subunit alpha [Anaerolineae bacterium]
MKLLLSGNEALALGAWEAGVQYASAYPGTPSTEILENFARYPGIKAEWASNEKVALDNAIGASFGGARTLVTMKHVGVNVAADSLMSLSYTGVQGGLVLVSADDPGAFSSQNEQDNRQYARFGKFPCFDPSDSEDARQFMGVALEVSERFKTPVMLRSTTRLSHSKSAVEAKVPEKREFQPLPKFEREEEVTRVILPAVARKRHPQIEQRLLDVAAWAETTSINRVEWGDKKIGIVTTGIAYQYVREVFAGFSILKLGMSYPLPLELVRSFAEAVDALIVVEELDPFIEEQIKAAGIAVAHGKDITSLCGELTLSKLRAGALQAGLPVAPAPQEVAPIDEVAVPARPPALCPGCPHRAFFYNMRRNRAKAMIAGDIGCYSMGVLPPFQSMDMLISMGASIGMAHGFKQAGGQESAVATIGDSTFFHSGMSPLAAAVYNQSNITVVVLDNRITAMTGQQDHPGTGITLQHEEGTPIDIAAVVRAMGVKLVEEVNAWDVEGVNKALKEAMEHEEGPAVIIVRGACVFTPHFHLQPRMRVDTETCIACGTCFRVGCPAILKSEAVNEKTGKHKATIDPLLCTGCTVCMQVCPVNAIAPFEASYKEEK